MRIENMTRDDFAATMEKDPLIILPLGATEAHGPHLPLGTDSLQPEWVADRLAEKITALVAPPLHYGMHSSTRNMPGTIDISFETLHQILFEILESFVRQGGKRFLVLSGHAGSTHMAAVTEACRRIVYNYGVKLMLLSDYSIADELAAGKVSPGDGHGGAVETSRIMHIRPELVKKMQDKGYYQSKGYMVIPNPETCFPQGYAGDLSEASAELGKELDEGIVNTLIRMIEREGL